MAQVDVGVTELEFGLQLVEGDPGLTLVLFIAFSLVFIIGARFGYYAHRNLLSTALDTQRPIWGYLRYVGAFATAYGLAGVVDILVSLDLAFKNVFLLAVALASAAAIRQIQQAGTAGDGGRTVLEQVLRLGFVALLVVYVVFVLAAPGRVAAGVEGVAGLVYLSYGLSFFQSQATNARLQGTLLDSLLRHVFPLLAFSSLVSVLAVATAAGLDSVVVWHVQVVFIIMTGTALMTGTIKLRQNLASL
jgi:hypothetical protein